MNKEQLEEIYNQTFPGLTLFYRDADLNDTLVNKYYVGQILTERGFTDMSYKGGGLVTKMRYLIASANGRHLSAFDPLSADTGHAVLKSKTFFKVLDIYEIGDKKQVLLLEIPAAALDLFAASTSNVEEEIVKSGRASFDAKANAAPVAALQTDEWRERTSYPIGMSEQGELFYQPNGTEKTDASFVAPVESTVENSTANEKKSWWKFW